MGECWGLTLVCTIGIHRVNIVSRERKKVKWYERKASHQAELLEQLIQSASNIKWDTVPRVCIDVWR